MRKWGSLGSVLVVIGITACVNHATDIYNVDRVSYSAVDALSSDQAEKVIRNAGTKLGWDMDTIKPGLIRGTLNVRSHLAIVDVSYDGRAYSIDYIESENLKYDEATGNIHKSYNKWIRNLERQIKIESGLI